MPADRGRRRGQRGLTLVELLVTVLLLGIAMAICLAVFVTVGRSVDTADKRSQNNDQARLAVQQIDRQIRSGNVLYDPAAETPAGLSMRIYTQSNGAQRCVQWKVTTTASSLAPAGTLQTRSWSESWRVDSDVSEWRNVAYNLVNTTTSLGSPAFAFDTAGGFGDRLISVRILTNANPAKQKTVEVKAAVTGRNTEYGYSPTICNDIP